jgi:hypothetical protein
LEQGKLMARNLFDVAGVQCKVLALVQDIVLGSCEPARTLTIKKAQSLADKPAL